jgi:hypothetical protein
MKIAIKTQTARTTNYKEGFNCVNLFLNDRFNNADFSMSLQVTAWGENNPIEPVTEFEIDGKTYRFTIPELKVKLS